MIERRKSSQRFLNLLKLSIASFVCMGVLIGYHGAPLINSLIGVFWFLFAMTSGMVVFAAINAEAEETSNLEELEVDEFADQHEPACCNTELERRRKARSEQLEKVLEPI